MEESENHYSIEELAELVNLPVRTIRYYISEGLVAGPGARGKAAVYGQDHLLRLRLIRLLSRQHVPLGEMRNQLTPLSINEIRALLTDEVHVAQLEQTTPSPPESYVATLLRQARAEQQGLPSQMSGLSGNKKGAEAAPASPAGHLAPMAELWHRWELIPGIELHVRADSESQHCSLLERLFQVVGKHYP